MSFLSRLREFFRPPEESPVLEAMASLPAELLTALQSVEDPELHIDLVSLGLIRSVILTEASDGAPPAVDVQMTLTTKGCPLSKFIVFQVEHALKQAGYTPTVSLVWDPPWSSADMTPEAKLKMSRHPELRSAIRGAHHP